MEIISIKLENNLLKKVDSLLIEEGYSTRTEFLREAIRDKLQEIKRKKLVMKYYGASKRKTTNKQLHEAREKAFREIEMGFK